MKIILCTFIFLISNYNFSQEKPNFDALDSLYREDQFYVGITYNALINRPEGISQKKFTPSFSFGFLRDMPVNKDRTRAIAVGLGYSINNYNQNLLLTDDNGSVSYKVIGSDIVYDKNKLILHYIDLPIELRWRNSTPQNHKFYRVYGGFKFSYLVYNNSKFVGSPDMEVTNSTDFRKFQYGAFIDFGYNALNFYFYYGINSLLASGSIDGKKIEMKTINFGLMFYIL